MAYGSGERWSRNDSDELFLTGSTNNAVGAKLEFTLKVTYDSDTTNKLKCIAIEPKSVLIGGNDYFVKKIAYENNINEFENDSSASISRFEFWFNKPTGKLTKSFFEFQEFGNILTRHQGKANVVFCDGHVESPTLKFLFEDTSDTALARWNRDHQPHPEKW